MTSPMLSAHAALSLARAMRHPLALRGKALGPRLRERLILRVSAVNRCTVCSAIHGAVGRLTGLTAHDIHAARTPETDKDLDEETRLLFHYAEIRTANLTSDFPGIVERFDRTFSEEVKREVWSLVDLFTFNNRFNNTWEALLWGVKRRRGVMGMAEP